MDEHNDSQLELVALALQKLLHSSKYLSARLVRGKEWFISYYVVHPVTGRNVRMREKVNRVKDKKERLRYAKGRVREINAALAMGWNPFRYRKSALKAPLLKDALADFIKTKIREKIRPDSVRSYASMLKIFRDWLQRKGITEISVEHFDEQHARTMMTESFIERDLSARSFNNYHTFYITLWNWLVENDYCKRNVFKAVKKKREDPDGSRRRPPTAEERQRIRAYLTEHNPRFFTFCLLCFHCGIRPKEACMLKPEHFRLEENHIVIPGTVAKNRRTQGIAIPTVLMPALRGLNIGNQQPDDYVFSTGFEPGPKLCTSRDSARTWDKMRDAIGLSKEVTFYQLKHAGGEQLSRDGVSEVDLMNHLRHHDLSETSTYTRRSYKQGVRDVLDKASPF